MNWNLVKLLVPLAFLAVLFTWHEHDKHQAVTTAVAKVEQVYKSKLDAANLKAHKDQADMQMSTDKLRQDEDEKINSINTQLNAALIRLRNRPERPSGTPQDSNNSQACTGRELYREDGEFLTREAARAEAVLAERDYYYQQYEEVRKKYNGTTE